MKAAILSTIAVQAEATYAGAGTGTIFALCGLTEFDQQFDPMARSTRINIWRLEESQQKAGASLRGRVDIELKVGSALNLLVNTILAIQSQTDVDGGTQFVYRLRRAEDMATSVRLLGAFEDGPWFTLSGVVVTTLRLTVRARQVVRMAIDWVASGVENTSVNPAWDIVEESLDVMSPVSGDDGAIHGEDGGIYYGSSVGVQPLVAGEGQVLLDDVPMTESVELSLEIEAQREARNLSRLGAANRMVRSGPVVVGGNLVEYFVGNDLPEKVRDGSEFSLSCALAEGSVDRFVVALPRVVAQNGQPSIRGDTDIVGSVPFKALSDFGATDEVLVTLVVV